MEGSVSEPPEARAGLAHPWGCGHDLLGDPRTWDRTWTRISHPPPRGRGAPRDPSHGGDACGEATLTVPGASDIKTVPEDGKGPQNDMKSGCVGEGKGPGHVHGHSVKRKSLQ